MLKSGELLIFVDRLFSAHIIVKGTAINGRRFGLLILIIGCQEVLLPDDSSTMRKEALMTDFELLSLVIGIISLVVIVRKK